MTSKICIIKQWHQQVAQMMLMLVILTALLFSNAFAAEKPYPGEIYDIGTHRLHMNCVGEGSPTVIIDSGAGGFSLEWINIQNNLAENAKVCSYDRAGYGFSDPGPMPRTTAQIVFELKRLIDAAKLTGPFVLVGHSFGGYNIRYFASLYPELVAGMVLVDASHPQQFKTEEFKPVVKKNNSDPYQKTTKKKLRMMKPVISSNFPGKYRHQAYLLMMSMKAKLTIMDELQNMPQSAEQLLDDAENKSFDFPVVIISRGKRVYPHNEMGDRREERWMLLQTDLTHVSTQTWHYVAQKSGHIVHLDEPELVSSNILFAVNQANDYATNKKMIEKYDIRMAKIEKLEPVYNLRFEIKELEMSPFLVPQDRHSKLYSADFELPDYGYSKSLNF